MLFVLLRYQQNTTLLPATFPTIWIHQQSKKKLQKEISKNFIFFTPIVIRIYIVSTPTGTYKYLSLTLPFSFFFFLSSIIKIIITTSWPTLTLQNTLH